MADAVLDDRLQEHARHQPVQSFRVDFFDEPQFLAEAHHLDAHVVVDERQLFPQRREVVGLAQQPPQDAG